MPGAGPRPNIGGQAGFYPMPDWPSADPVAEGFDVAGLEAASQYAQGFGSHCLLVFRQGQVVFERYYGANTPQTLHKSWSIAKSHAGALTGVMLEQGHIDSTEQRVVDYLPEWGGKAQHEQIRILDILNMVSGLTFDLISDNTWTVFTADMTAEAVNNTVTHAPDTVYEYSNHGVQVLDAVVENATGMDPEAYAKQFLWGPLGMDPRTAWERDGAGNVTMFMGVTATCRDFARLGYLYLFGGNWAGNQIIDRDYIVRSLTPSSSVNAGHSHYIWLNGFLPYTNSTQEPQPGIMFPMAPPDLFGFQGIGQNFVDVVPSTGVMYVHMHLAPHDPFTNFIFDLTGTMDRLFRDGRNIEHKELLNILVPASP